MTRFAWLQTRTQTLVAIVLLVAVAVVAAITGVQLAHEFAGSVAHCSTDCGFAISRFLSRDTFIDHALDILARAVPVLLGMFWGAPLIAREFETGTYRLAWTQSVSRKRWLATKLAVGGAATLLVTGAFTLTVTWWYSSRDQVGGTGPFQVFDRRDIVPVAYAVFAFAVGALLGAVIRRTVPAMAATLGVFVFVRIAISLWVQPYLQPPIRKVLSLVGASPRSQVQLGIETYGGGHVRLFVQAQGPPRSWTLSSTLLTRSGGPASSTRVAAFVQRHCPNASLLPVRPPAGGAVTRVAGADPGRACLAKAAHAFRVAVTYQPANRYWTFQWLETGLYVLLTIAAIAACFWRVTRRPD